MLRRCEDKPLVKPPPAAGDELADKLRLVAVILSLTPVSADVCRHHPAPSTGVPELVGDTS